MKKLLLIFMLISSPVHARGGGAITAPCSATAPSQATANGLTKLVACDTFSSLQNVDTANSGTPGLDWYRQSPQTAYPLSTVTNDGTGASWLSGSSSTNSGKVGQTVGNSSVLPYYVGHSYTGSWYVEIDAKFNPITPSGQSGSNQPSFWLNDFRHYVDATHSGAFGSGYNVEIDIMEMLQGASGQASTPNGAIHYWYWNGSTNAQQCSTSGGQLPGFPSAGNATYNNYHTYGALLLVSSDNGGTGQVKWYFDNTLLDTCTYSVSGAPTCVSQSIIGCGAGAFSQLDTQLTTFMVGTGYVNWPVTVRNFHVWQKP